MCRQRVRTVPTPGAESRPASDRTVWMEAMACDLTWGAEKFLGFIFLLFPPAGCHLSKGRPTSAGHTVGLPVLRTGTRTVEYTQGTELCFQGWEW